MSPHEWSAPYHEFMLQEMQELMRRRLNLPAFEALHLSHCMLEIVKGFLTGSTHKWSSTGDGSWRKHIFSCKDGSGKKTVVNFFTRLEFQDGTHKAPTQEYHGSGRPHLHCLIWLENEETIKLDKVISATMHPDPLGAYVRGSQEDKDGVSKWPVREELSTYDEEAQRLLLQHTQDDADNGRRAFFPALMDAWPCHEDVQISDGEALLLQYVTKYVSKFTDANYDEWLNDEASADSVAWRVLTEYHPMEPEMILQLSGGQFKQWNLGTAQRGKRDIIAPDGTQETQELAAYMDAEWRRDSMSFLEHLRKTNVKGNINNWLKKLHAKSDSLDTLEAFANEYVMKGEQVAAVDMLSRNNDRFFKQWLHLHVPFRKLRDLELSEQLLATIPRRLHGFARPVRLR